MRQDFEKITLPRTIADQSNTSLYRTVAMLSSFWDEVATHIYNAGSDIKTIWGTNVDGNVIFQFLPGQSPDSQDKIAEMLKDAHGLESSIPRSVDLERNILAFPDVQNVIYFLEHLSTEKNWQLNSPMEEVVAGSMTAVAKKKARKLEAFPPDSVKFLRKSGYAGLASAREEFAAAYVAKLQGLPHPEFTFTLNEIRRSLEAHKADTTGITLSSCEDGLRFH